MKAQQRIVLETLTEADQAFRAGDYEAARASYEYVRAAMGDEARTEVGHASLADVLNNLLACAQPLRDWAEMKAVATDLIALDETACDPWIRLSIGLKHLGELSRATEAIQHAIELDADDSNARYEHACQLAVAGDLDAALDRVAEAVERGARRADLQADDELASLRGLPRFRELMKKR